MVGVDIIVSMLQACRRSKDLNSALLVFAFACEQALDTHGTIGNHVVPVLVDGGSLADARFMFDRLPHRNEVSFSCLILGLVDHGDTRGAFWLYHQMQEKHVQPTTYTFLSLLRACAQVKGIEAGRCLHFDIVTWRYEVDLSVANALVDMYGKCGSIEDAYEVLSKAPDRDVVSWNALIAGYAEHGLSMEALRCFHQMQLEDVGPDAVTFVCSLKACSSIGAIEEGQIVLTEVMKRGLENNVFVGSILIDMYAKCGFPLEAWDAFSRLSVQNVVSWTALITGYVDNKCNFEGFFSFEQMQLEGVSPNSSTYVSILKACNKSREMEKGQQLHCDITKRGLEQEPYVGNALVDMYVTCELISEAREVFNKLLIKDAISWATLISGYAESGHDEEVLDSFKKLMLQGVSIDTPTLARCLKSCGNIGAIEVAREIHADIRKLGFENNLSIANTLIDIYGKCGSLNESQRVFEGLHVRDAVTWSAMIKAYGENHEGEMAVRCFEEMQLQGVKPDAVTFTCLLGACSHANLILKGKEFFKVMQEDHKCEPSPQHYACMVDLLARSGQIHEAEKYLNVSCLSSLTALLNACKLYGKVELGSRCFEQLVELDHEDAGPYLLMVDVYTSIGRLNNAYEIKQMMQGASVHKKPACAMIELNKQLHQFVPSTNMNAEAQAMVQTLGFRLKYKGYVPTSK